MEGSAFVEEPQASNDSYKVLGHRNFLGFEPGDTIPAGYVTPEQAARAIERGQLEVVGQTRVSESVTPPSSVPGTQTTKGLGDAGASKE